MPVDEAIERFMDARFALLARSWAARRAPEGLRGRVQAAIGEMARPARSRARAFLDQLARERDLLAEILADPGRLLPVCLERLGIAAADFAAELERLKAESAAAGSRELSDDEAAGVVAAGQGGGLTVTVINQLAQVLAK